MTPKSQAPEATAIPKRGPTWFVYMLRCRGGVLYTGTARNVQRRVAVHNSGKGARFTRSHRPVKLLWSRRFASRSAALIEEARIKRWTRQEKLEFLKRKIYVRI